MSQIVTWILMGLVGSLFGMFGAEPAGGGPQDMLAMALQPEAGVTRAPPPASLEGGPRNQQLLADLSPGPEAPAGIEVPPGGRVLSRPLPDGRTEYSILNASGGAETIIIK